MDSEVAERFHHLEARISELKQHLEKHYATKGEIAVQFGKVHLEIAKLESTMIKWFVGTAAATAGVAFGIGRYFS
jgi:hypothetical protein